MPVRLIVVGFRASLVVAVRLLQKHQIKRLVVLDADNEMVGIVSRRDLLAGLSVVPKASTHPPNRLNSTRQGRLRAPRPPAARLGTFGRCEPGPKTLARALSLSESPWHPSPCRHARTGALADGATGRFHVLAESGNALRARVGG
jgi:hypothetical protein